MKDYSEIRRIVKAIVKNERRIVAGKEPPYKEAAWEVKRDLLQARFDKIRGVQS